MKLLRQQINICKHQLPMDPYEAEALMRFNSTILFNRLSAKANTLIDTTASLNFVSK
jgi:hypothetical protein